MPMSARTTLLAAATIPLAVAAAAPASAAETTDVIFAFTVDGSTVTNTITNNSGTNIGCGTSLAPAPDRVLPPVRDVLSAGQSLYETGEVQPGTTTQSVMDVPDGSYVALASCSRTDTDPAMWISDYPGIEDYLAQWPGTEFTVQQASTVVTVAVAGEDPAPPAAGDAPDVDDLGTIFGS
ncbi:hypothetical protein [Rhodococcus jostii]|uniref:Secreted protein n=1 Tax=Rhodococcus jostii TaxID=132919 RepID=A0ABU4CEI7_RHOJO|nr:hypothetical protein [Rhodococcus jostii]MDV6281974.1 hypothetical protein [Rhodococcus jostii]